MRIYMQAMLSYDRTFVQDHEGFRDGTYPNPRTNITSTIRGLCSTLPQRKRASQDVYDIFLQIPLHQVRSELRLQRF